MINNIYGNIDKISRGLDYSWIRNEVLSNNIANIDTPGFKRSDVSFSKVLEDQSLKLKTTREKHIGNIPYAGSDISIY